ncbi:MULTISPECIES: DUF6318 family protein [unclassified Nocardioides]|uniref:DUF6318 family protein n=1 Tax=unclassified Nocardioides TaxID=2615069 RepID=UPI0036076E49
MSRTWAVVAILVSTLCLAACSDDDPEPQFAPPSSSSEAPSSPTTTEAAEFDNPEDVVRAWVEARNAALSTGDTSDLRALTANGCQGCSPFIESIENVYEEGGHLETAGWTVVAAKVRTNSRQIRVDAGVKIAGGRSYASAGAEPIRFSADNVMMTFAVSTGMKVSLVAFVE